MAITRKPIQKPAPTADVDALIRKGGSVPGGERKRKPVVVNLRLSPDILQRIDAELAARPLKVPRHQWLLEAILAKLGD